MPTKSGYTIAAGLAREDAGQLSAAYRVETSRPPRAAWPLAKKIGRPHACRKDTVVPCSRCKPGLQGSLGHGLPVVASQIARVIVDTTATERGHLRSIAGGATYYNRGVPHVS